MSEDNVIWAVESGSYSGYSVHAIFSSEEAAEEAAAMWNGREKYGDYRATIFYLDPDPKQGPTHSWELEDKDYPLGWGDQKEILDDTMERGHLVRVYKSGATTVIQTMWKKDENMKFNLEDARKFDEVPDIFEVQVSYAESNNDWKVAEKIAHDRIAEWKAAQEGIS